MARCCSQEAAREAAGGNIFDPRRAQACLGSTLFTAGEEAALGIVPYAADLIEETMGEFALVAVPAVSLVRLEEIAPSCFWPGMGGSWSWRDLPLAKRSGAAGWLLVRLGAAPGSLGRSLPEQLGLLPRRERAVSVRELVYTVCLLRAGLTGKPFPEGLRLRCRDSDGLNRMLVAVFPNREPRIDISPVADSASPWWLGLGSVLRPSK